MKRLLRWLPRLLILGLVLLGSIHWASRTQAPILAAGVTKEVRQLTLAGRGVSVTLYYPADHAAAPLVVVAHGFTRSKRYMAGWGAELAAQGFLAAVPTQPALVNHELNARALAELVTQLRTNVLPLKVRCNGKAALMGHSMGGLTTLLAATKTPVDAWIGLDPVDMDGSGAKAAAGLKIPAAVLRAEPEAWNMHGNATTIIDALPPDTFSLQVCGGTHLDAEWPTDLLGQLACGFTDSKRQALFKHYAIAFLKATLMDDAEAAQVLADASADTAISEVTNTTLPLAAPGQ
ncbi:MAG: alpha/beta fold hydrolase [Prosthecobacter sp.]|nr:alpha/beta fold hydrolase [Prosthecobacter sp.]